MNNRHALNILILSSHPIQYQAPLFKAINEEGSIYPLVYFFNNTNNDGSYDPEFGKKIKWDLPLLDGYDYKFASKKFEVFNLIFRRRPKFDAILIFGWNSLSIIFAYFASLISGTKILLRAESPLSQEVLKKGILQKIKRVLLGVFFKGVGGFLCIGEENKKFYKFLGVPDGKLFFAPYAVDNERFFADAKKYLPQKEEIRKKLNIKEAAKVILFAGKLIDKKRPFDLLRAYENLAIENKAIIFVGEGGLRDKLEKYVGDKKIQNVHFVGFKNQTEIGEYYAAADIFVLPSGIGETWGLVVNEAMCFGLPVIVSNIVGCAPDLVHHGYNGFIYRTEDFIELSERIYELVTDTEKSREFGKKSLEIIKNYDFKSDIDGIRNALNSFRGGN